MVRKVTEPDDPCNCDTCRQVWGEDELENGSAQAEADERWMENQAEQQLDELAND